MMYSRNPLMTNYNKFGSNYCHWWLNCGSLGEITTKINEIESVNGCGCPKLTEWELAPLHWIHPWLVHIGSENVGTWWSSAFHRNDLQCIITRPDNLGDNTLCAFNGTFPIGHLEEVPLDCDFVQCFQEYHIFTYHIFKQTCTVYFCLHWLLATSEKQSMLSIVGCSAFRLLMILARKLAIPSHQRRWQRIQLCYRVIPCQIIRWFPRTSSDSFEIWHTCRNCLENNIRQIFFYLGQARSEIWPCEKMKKWRIYRSNPNFKWL